MIYLNYCFSNKYCSSDNIILCSVVGGSNATERNALLWRHYFSGNALRYVITVVFYVTEIRDSCDEY